MYTQVASKLAVVSGTTAFSQAVAMAGANAALFEFTVFAKGGGDVDVQLQGSNDLENWEEVGAATGGNAVGYFASTAQTAIAYQYVRLMYTQNTSGTAIVAAGINTANL